MLHVELKRTSPHYQLVENLMSSLSNPDGSLNGNDARGLLKRGIKKLQVEVLKVVLLYNTALANRYSGIVRALKRDAESKKYKEISEMLMANNGLSFTASN